MVTAMASVKLVSGPIYHSHCYPYDLSPTNLSQQIMTLDDSLPRSSTSTDYDPGSDSARDMSSPPSPTGSESRDPHSLSDTPTKKNKRKLSEPKKRTDLSCKKVSTVSNTAKQERIQLICQDKKLTNGHSQSSSSCKSSGKIRNNQIKRDTSSSSSSQSNNDSDYNKDNQLHSLSNAINPSFVSHIFSGVPPSTFGFVPGLYLTGKAYPGQSTHASFTSIPPSLHHSYTSVATATGSHSSRTSLTAVTPSMYSLGVARFASSKLEETVSEMPDQVPLQTSTNQPVPCSSLIVSQPSSYSVLHIQPSSLHRPCNSRTITTNNDDDDDDDDDDEALSSRAPSPEDLSVGSRLSRKHRKNYKNMTRERRVEANARERTRVHTISAAFDALRRAVPSYSHNQKLSKLAILRIASSYIVALARLNDPDYTSASEHIGKSLSFAECVDMCTSTIQTEGRARRRH